MSRSLSAVARVETLHDLLRPRTVIPRRDRFLRSRGLKRVYYVATAIA